jgi:acyl-CoA thioesterase-2
MPIAVSELWDDLLACLDLRTHPTDAPFVFEGRNQRLGYHRLFGGQLLAQFVRVAHLTCPDKTVKSVHALFAQAGRPEEPVRHEVDRHHDGGSFAALTIVARQSTGVMATPSVSLHVPENGPTHQTAPAVPSYGKAGDPLEAYWGPQVPHPRLMGRVPRVRRSRPAHL